MLTFDMIRELERQERSNRKMQKLPSDLIEEINDYISRKEQIQEKNSTDILELENVKNTIKRFFEMREKKLADMALLAARTGFPPENLDSGEEKIFYKLVDVIKENRERFFFEIHKDHEHKVITEIKAAEEPKPEKIIFRVKKEIPEFVGPDMKIYRLIKGEVTNLPKPINDLLLKEGFIEEIRE